MGCAAAWAVPGADVRRPVGPPSAPQAERAWEVGANRLIRAKARPYRAALRCGIAACGV
jgi:hypothetical protein